MLLAHTCLGIRNRMMSYLLVYSLFFNLNTRVGAYTWVSVWFYVACFRLCSQNSRKCVTFKTSMNCIVNKPGLSSAEQSVNTPTYSVGYYYYVDLHEFVAVGECFPEFCLANVKGLMFLQDWARRRQNKTSPLESWSHNFVWNMYEIKYLKPINCQRIWQKSVPKEQFCLSEKGGRNPVVRCPRLYAG